MKTTLPWSFVLAVLSACGASQAPANQPAAADSPNCASMAQSFDALCADPSMRQANPEAMAGVRSGMEQQHAFITANCRTLATPERVAKMDACLAQVRGVAQTSGSEAAARRSAAAPKVPEVRADPAFQAATAKVRTLLDEQTLHCENADNATKDGSPNAELWRRKCLDAQDRASAANAERNAILGRHGIDPRDAAALGLGL